jgi:predicted AAA+ superfamily ATPase
MLEHTLMKPWREIAVPHSDVLEGTFLQSEFAADITAVHTGKASPEYQNATAFFQRTFITEGMSLLLTSVAKRLNGQGGDPVIQLQTAFGGGKTHTMLAVYHLATRECPLKDMLGIPDLLDRAGMMDIPKSRVVVLDGTARAPGQAWKYGKQTINTLWGDLAWQLGGDDAYALVKDADTTGTSPGKNVLKTLLETYAPCVVLVDELVAYIRQFPNGQTLSGGSYDSNLSFVQALTEAIKLVPNAIMLASLPESEIEAGSNRGLSTLQALEKTFGRLQALWKPVATEEAFEIVRRRLFEPVRDAQSRDAVCRAFADAYIGEGSKLPSETQQARYFNRLVQAYPIHPEVFDRLYEDWTTLQGFQRTRGVLKLMAKVIHRLWKDQNQDLMILPGSLPLYDSNTRNELTYYLAPGWDAVLERDVDGDRAETTELETKEPRFGAISAARRVARTIFLGSAPSAAGTQKGVRGVDRARVLLGCLQPGQSSSTFSDALNRLADRLHYLNSSGDKAQDATRFWFDTRANLRREMEDRKGRFNDQNEVRGKLADVLRKLIAGASFFDGSHIFTPHTDVPDDGALRLVFLSPEKFYSKQEARLASDEVLDFVRNNGSKPRYRGNRLIFIAPDHASLSRVRDYIRTALAWNSIIADVREKRLNIDGLQEEQAKKELQSAEDVLPRVARECYKWLLCPVQATPTDRQPTVEAFPLNTSGSSFGTEIERVCHDNELIISIWSPIHLRDTLKKLYWKDGKDVVAAMAFWEDMQRYLYLPRLKDRHTLEQAIVKGAATKDFFGTAYGQTGDDFEGFKLGDANVQLDDTLLLIEAETAKQYEVKFLAASTPNSGNPGGATSPSTITPGGRTLFDPPAATTGHTPTTAAGKAKSFYGSVEVNPSTAKIRLVQLVEEIINHLASDSHADLKITVEINADFPNGASDQIKRAVSENAKSLGFKNWTWE